MHQAEAFALGLEADLWQQRSQVGFVLFSCFGSRPDERLLPAGFFLRVSIRTTAVITVEPDAIIVVAHDGRDIALSNEADRLIWTCPITDQVTETMDGIRGPSSDRLENGCCGGAIAMQIGEDGDAGAHADARSFRG